MTAQPRAQLYTYFETGDKPTQAQFKNLIDSSLNIAESSAQRITGDVSALGNFAIRKDLLVSGFASFGSSMVNGDLTINGVAFVGVTLTVSGATIFGDDVTFINQSNISVDGNATIGGSLSVNNSAATTLTGPLTVVGKVTPQAGIVGITNGSNAAPGNIGEVVKVTIADDTVPMVANTAATIATLPLLPGDYDVWATVRFGPEASTTISQVLGGISSSAGILQNTDSIFALNCTFLTGAALVQSTPTIRVNVSASANYYLIGQANFAVSGMNGGGTITARRRR